MNVLLTFSSKVGEAWLDGINQQKKVSNCIVCIFIPGLQAILRDDSRCLYELINCKIIGLQFCLYSIDTAVLSFLFNLRILQRDLGNEEIGAAAS